MIVEYEIVGEETITVHYANQMEHFDAQKAVVTFAKFMNEKMNEENVCSGTFENMSSAWSEVSAKYDELFGSGTSLNDGELAWAKSMLQYANALWGSDEENACVEKAMKTYEVCVKNYGMTAFMSTIRPLSAFDGRFISTIIGSNSSAIMIIAIVSSISGVAIFGYFLLKKKKNND